MFQLKRKVKKARNSFLTLPYKQKNISGLRSTEKVRAFLFHAKTFMNSFLQRPLWLFHRLIRTVQRSTVQLEKTILLYVYLYCFNASPLIL
jgi:hypothetical protein